MSRKRDRKGRPPRSQDEIEAAVEEVGELVSDAVVGVGDAVSAIVQTVAGNIGQRRRKSPAERLLKQARRKRKDWLGHRNAYVAVNTGLVGINVGTAVLSGSLFPWFVFPALGWGIGLAIHRMSYGQWLADNSGRIAAAQEEVSRLPQPQAPSPRSREIAADPRWSRLVSECERAVRAAEASLSRASDAVLSEQTRERLNNGLNHLHQLAEGGVAVQGAIAAVVPDGVDGLSDQLSELDERIGRANDPKLVEVYRENRALLAMRHDKVVALQAEHDRMFARAEGFLIAVQNIQLDASRARTQGAGIDTLTEPLRQLSEEVEILRQVEAELAQIG